MICKIRKSGMMILRQNSVKVDIDNYDYVLPFKEDVKFFKHALYFDLEHYVNKKPICVGVFGCSYYDDDNKTINTIQYMIENKKDSVEILYLAKNYFEEMKNKHNKRFIVTFAGNNDFTVINRLFEKNKLNYNLRDNFIEIDLQKEYEKSAGKSIGLKKLEKEFDIIRESELISGQNLAKTFKKIVKDSDYTNRMPDEKKNKILLYNYQDVRSLFDICMTWKKYMK